MNRKTIVNTLIFVIAAVLVVALQYSNEANTAAEIEEIISAGVGNLEICSIKGEHITEDCSKYSSTIVLEKFIIALKGGRPTSGSEHLGTTLERALKISSQGIEYWYIAIEYEGIPDKLYLSKIELISPTYFSYTPNRYVLPDNFSYIFSQVSSHLIPSAN